MILTATGYCSTCEAQRTLVMTGAGEYSCRTCGSVDVTEAGSKPEGGAV